MSEIVLYKDDEIYCHHTCDYKPKPEDFITHQHDYAELCIFISGKGTFHVEGSSYSMTPGDIVLFRRAESHYIEIDSNYPYERFALHFRESLFSSVDRGNVLMQPYTNREAGMFNVYHKSEFDCDAYNSITSNLLRDTSEKRLNIISNLILLLLEIKPLFEKKQNNGYINTDTPVYRIINDINQNLYSNLTLDGICEKHYISKSQLCKIFKSATGSSVWQYVTSKRLLTAREMIYSGITPTKACYACGFNDYSSFYRAYIKKFDESPKKK